MSRSDPVVTGSASCSSATSIRRGFEGSAAGSVHLAVLLPPIFENMLFVVKCSGCQAYHERSVMKARCVRCYERYG